MKLFVFISALLFSLPLFAYKSIYVTGRGSDNAYCSANSGYFCLDNTKRRAEAEADRDARWACESINRGRAVYYSASHYTYCSPSSLPSNNEPTWVSCRSESRMECVLEN